ncbi:MAG: pyruvate kinase [Hyphomicrobiaceae bacterium]|nr:pyruvate kinase [Hyphomicrobiaceae bacterium]
MGLERDKATANTEFEDVQAVLGEVTALRESIATDDLVLTLQDDPGARDPGVANLAHYLALRRHDPRNLQRKLMRLGLSSLGRLESRVLPTLDAVIFALSAMLGRASPHPLAGAEAFFAGEERLKQASDELFGPAIGRRRTRIMVTLPSEAAEDARLVLGFARAGMNVARINCAHDDAAAWEAMVDQVRAAEADVGRSIAVFMDIAGPKIRTADVAHHDKHAKLQTGHRLRLTAGGPLEADKHIPVAASVSLPQLIGRLKVGESVLYDDAKLMGVVEEVRGEEVIVRVRRTKTGGVKIKPEKGLNFPDTRLDLAALTAEDEDDLATVIKLADIVGYSFVEDAEDIDLLEAALVRHGIGKRKLGIVAKIERPDAVTNLPAIIARTRGRRPFGVMIARGDLASEIGFERLAEMQEEILWICEAASVPAIWATQVLEDLVKEGVPSRGEMTDAAMSARAECVMLNKGASEQVAVELLDRLLERMDSHIFKKTPILRPLKSW